jgi:hypothetical protein
MALGAFWAIVPQKKAALKGQALLCDLGVNWFWIR